METYQIEKALYQYRFQVSEEETKARIPYRDYPDHIRKRAIPSSANDQSAKLLNQVLFRGGMMVVVGIIYYLVTLAV